MSTKHPTAVPGRSIELSLVRSCPVRCDYCPQDKLTEATRKHADDTDRCMSETNLHKIMGNARPSTTVFAGFTEPTAHPYWLEFVELAATLSRVVVYTTGWRLNREDLPRLRRIVEPRAFSVHVTKKTWGNLEICLPAIAEHFPGCSWLYIDRDTTPLREIRRKVSPHFAVQHKQQITRASNLVHIEGHERRIRGAVRCHKSTDKPMPVVLPNGLAVACCNDYKLELPLGNLTTTPWHALHWKGLRDRQDDPHDCGPCHRDCHFARKVSP